MTTEATERDELTELIANVCEDVVYVNEIADALLAAGYRRSRTITTVEELDALADGSAILDTQGDVAQKLSGLWHFPETAPMGASKVLKYGVTVTLLREGGAA